MSTVPAPVPILEISCLDYRHIWPAKKLRNFSREGKKKSMWWLGIRTRSLGSMQQSTNHSATTVVDGSTFFFFQFHRPYLYNSNPSIRTNAWFTIWRKAIVLRCVEVANAKIFKISCFFHDKTQERNAEECKDRIQVCPYVATSVNVKATQRNASHCIILWTGLNSMLLTVTERAKQKVERSGPAPIVVQLEQTVNTVS